MLINATTPKVAGFTLGAFLNMVERGRFSALIAPVDVMRTDIGELRDYAAYIYDPYDAATAAIQGDKFVQDMQYVFENASPEAVNYLKENIGHFAQANGGLVDWRTDLNVRITNELPIYKDHKILLNFDCFNVLGI